METLNQKGDKMKTIITIVLLTMFAFTQTANGQTNIKNTTPNFVLKAIKQAETVEDITFIPLDLNGSSSDNYKNIFAVISEFKKNNPKIKIISFWPEVIYVQQVTKERVLYGMAAWTSNTPKLVGIWITHIS